MAIAQSRRAELSEIPVVDIGRLEGSERDASALARPPGSLRVGGFFYVTNHGVPTQATATIFTQAHRFFDIPMEEAAALAITRSPVYRRLSRDGRARAT